MPSTNVDAHTLATSVRYSSLTLSTQPASMTKSSCCQLLSSFRGTSLSGCCSALATQSGVNAWTTAASALAASISPAVPPVTQPPQAKPTTIAAIAPAIAPHTAGFTHSGTFIVKPPTPLKPYPGIPHVQPVLRPPLSPFYLINRHSPMPVAKAELGPLRPRKQDCRHPELVSKGAQSTDGTDFRSL